MAGGMHGREACVTGGHVWQGGVLGTGCVLGVCVARGHVWMLGRGACVAGGMHGRGACMTGGMCVRGHVWQGACMPRMPPRQYYDIRSMSWRYTS